MKITKQRLAEMIADSVRERLAYLHEASADDDDEPAGDDPKRNRSVDKQDQGEKPELGAGDAPGDKLPDPDADQAEIDGQPVGDGEQAAHDERDALDLDGDAGTEPSGEINDAISGKTVQSVSVEDKSQLLPGATQITLTFNETTDSLAILVTKSGDVKFAYKNQIHDVP